MTGDTLSLTVVICSRDRPEFLRDALSQIGELRAGPGNAGPIQIVVVDSASKGTETAAVAAEFGISAVRCDQPGLSRARNAGMRVATGEVVAFTDDDCHPTPDWIEQVRAGFADPLVGVVTGPVHPDRHTKRGVAIDDRDEDFAYEWGFNPAEAGHGANMSFRRSALQQVGDFDELLGAGSDLRSGEDVDMVWRVLRAGWEGRFESAAVITHRQWRSTSEAVRMTYGSGLGAGAFAHKARKLQPDATYPLPAMKRSRQSLRNAIRCLREGYQTGAAAEVFFAWGVVRGSRSVRRLAIANDNFIHSARS